MDFVNILTKLEKIENKQILTESEDRPAAKKKETTWTDKSGKKHPATQVQGSKSVAADKEADKDRKKHDKDLDESMFKTELGKSLVREFGYDLNEADNPWANDPEKSAAWSKLSPEDQKWLGGADPTDPYILARAPNKGKPAAATRGIGAATKPTDAAAPAAVPAGINPETGEQYDDGSNAPLTTPPGAEPEEPQASTLAEPPTDDGAATKPAEEPAAEPAKGGINPTVLNRYKELLDKLEGAGKAPAKPATAAKPATGAGTKPAAGGATMPGVDTMGNVTGAPMAETSLSEDDRILAALRSIAYR